MINGHHNLNGRVFKDLVNLSAGDTIQLFSGDQVFEYEVVSMQILEELNQPLEVQVENGRWILPTEDERLTLVTCWPYVTNTHRVVVVAEPMAAD